MEKKEEEQKVVPQVATIMKEESKLPRPLPPIPKLAIPEKSFSGRQRIRYLYENAEQFIGKVIFVAGWARTIRAQKKLIFCTLTDSSGPQNLQVVIDADAKGFTELSKMKVGASLGFKGEVVKSPKAEQKIELIIKNQPEHEAKIFGDCPGETYPLAKKDHTVEYLREIAHLRPRTQLIGSVIRVRNALIMASHTFFQSKGFLYIHTPIVTASDCEGAGQMFQVTTVLGNSNNEIAKIPTQEDKKTVSYKDDFFGKPAFLTVSGQLEGETYCCSMCDIYTFGPTFRAEKSDTPRHLGEFWMLEPEVAFADVNDVSDLGEDYLKYCVSYLLENNMDDLKFFEERNEKGLIERLKNIVENTFQRLTYTEAIKILEEHEKKNPEVFKFHVYWGLDLAFEHEKYLVEEYFKKPVILSDYPKDFKAFYMKLNSDNKTVRGIDVLVPKIGEIIGGSQREDDLAVLDKRMEEMKLDKANYSWYRDLRKYGSVPHSGFGVGFERLVMLATGIPNIRDTIPYPRWWGHAEF